MLEKKSHWKKCTIFSNSRFDDTTKSLYDDAFKKSSRHYDEALKESFKGVDTEKALNSEALIECMDKAKWKAYNSFDSESSQIDPESKHSHDAEEKLDKIVNSLESKMMDINKKNTVKSLQVAFPHSKNEKIESHNDIREYLKKLKYSEPNLD